MKSFNFDGTYVPASAIVSIKPPPVGAGRFNQTWEVALLSNRVFHLNVSDSGHHNARNLITTAELREYFGIPDTTAGKAETKA